VNIRLSKFNFYTKPFKEANDIREHLIIFSGRKCMGVKLNTELFQLVNEEQWTLLPDELFTLLMYYEILVHYELDERIEFYNFRTQISNHLPTELIHIDKFNIELSNHSTAIALEEGSLVSIDGLEAATNFFTKAEGFGKKKIEVILKVDFNDDSSIFQFLKLMESILTSDIATVKYVSIKVNKPSLLYKNKIFQKLHLFSQKVALNFMPIAGDYSASIELYSALLRYNIWGDYFSDLNEYSIYLKTMSYMEKMNINSILSPKHFDSEVVHLPLHIEEKVIHDNNLSLVNSCIEKMIFIKYKIWFTKTM
jgi:hypothetical protein